MKEETISVTTVTGVSTTSATEVSTSASSYYASGSYLGTTPSYSLSSVNYQSRVGNVFYATESSKVTSTSTSAAGQSGLSKRLVTGGVGSSQAAASSSTNGTAKSWQSVRQNSLQSANSGAALQELGRYSGGSFAFASIVYQARTGSGAGAQSTSLSSSTQTLTQNSSLSSNNSGINLGTGQPNILLRTDSANTSSMTTVSYQNGRQYSQQTSSSGARLYEAGSTGPRGLALTSVAYTQTASSQNLSQQQAQTTQVSSKEASRTQGSFYSLTWLTGARDFASVGCAVNSVSTNLGSSSVMTLSERGALSAGGSFSLASVLLQGSGGSSYKQSSSQNLNSDQTTTVSGSLATNFNVKTQPKSVTTINAVSVSSSSLTSSGNYGWADREAGKFAGGSFALSSVAFSDSSSSGQLYLANSAGTVNSTAKLRMAGTGTLGNSVSTSTVTGRSLTRSAVNSSQNASQRLYVNGIANRAGYNLSSYNLYATAGSSSFVTLKQQGWTTITSANSGGTERTTLAQATSQSQSSSVSELGSLQSGVLKLSQLSFTATGNEQVSYGYTSNDAFTGNAAGFDQTTINGSGAGNYSESGRGTTGVDSQGNPVLRLSQFTFTSHIAANFNLTQNGTLNGHATSSGPSGVSMPGGSGSMSSGGGGSMSSGSGGSMSSGSGGSMSSGGSNVQGGTNYSHTNVWSQVQDINETGSLTQGVNGPQWNFSNYLNTTTTNRSLTDSVGTSSDSATLYNLAQISGTGGPTNGSLLSVGSGSSNWNGRITSFGPVSVTLTTVLPTQAFGGVGPTGVPSVWPSLDQRVGSVAPMLTALAPQLGAQPPLGGIPNVTTPLLSAGMRALPPVLLGHSPMPVYGGWLGSQPPGSTGAQQTTFSPLAFLNLSEALSAVVNGVGQGPINLHNNPLRMVATGAVAGAADSAGVEVAYNVYAYLGMGIDAVAGFADALTSGALTNLLRYNNLNWLVDTSSASYQYGRYVGEAVVLVTSYLAPGWGKALAALQVAGSLVNAYIACQEGNYGQMWTDIAMAAVAVLPWLTSCAAESAVLRRLTGPVGPQAAGYLATASAWGVRGLGVYGAFNQFETAISRFQNGDVIGGLLSLGQGAVDLYQATRSCFTAEMLLDTADGKKRADTICVGDRLWSRDENDPDGPCELKEVEAVFVREAPIWNVHVAGQIIRTTLEHPFWVLGRGWIPAGSLEIGDLVSTRDGTLVPVEGAADSGAVETVYNWRVADYHTYFVGSSEWGCSVWAHNATSGIYEFDDKTAGGKKYVGQSKNIEKRLKQHAAAGRVTSGTEATTAVPGTKTAREVAEHSRIQVLTGGQTAGHSPSVANRVDPIGPARRPGLGMPEPTP